MAFFVKDTEPPGPGRREQGSSNKASTKDYGEGFFPTVDGEAEAVGRAEAVARCR